MALTTAYVLPTKRIPAFFEQVRNGQAPELFTQQLLKDWGFTSSNDKAFLPLLKALGFLSSDGRPTQRYHDYRDHSKAKYVMADAIRDTYSDLFLIKEHPTNSDKSAIEGKFKSFHNVSDNVASLMAATFFSLLTLADLSGNSNTKVPQSNDAMADKPADEDKGNGEERKRPAPLHRPSLHYNVQIHLPSTKDVEVYNAIFKSLKDHLLVE